MRDMGKAAGLLPVLAHDPVLSVDNMPRYQRTPQRTQEWIRLGCATETEASCEVNETPVHRCLLEPTTR